MTQFKKAHFCLDGLEGIFEGYTQGSLWNGWDCPYFEYTEALRVLSASRVNNYVGSYNVAEDSFIVDGPSNSEVFSAEQIEIGGQIIKVYPLGAYSWIWEQCPDQ